MFDFLQRQKRWRSRLIYYEEGPGFDSLWCPCKFATTLIFLSAFSSLHPLTEISAKDFFGVRCGRRVQLTSSVLAVLNVKMRIEAEHSIALLSLHDLLRESFTFYMGKNISLTSEAPRPNLGLT